MRSTHRLSHQPKPCAVAMTIFLCSSGDFNTQLPNTQIDSILHLFGAVPCEHHFSLYDRNVSHQHSITSQAQHPFFHCSTIRTQYVWTAHRFGLKMWLQESLHSEADIAAGMQCPL
mmetsp:Transcript_4719/g.17723  ORF Transcript_4719/g.17723 Transcript_4719/m.17723 type:complete len:116 (-) Transcript_4719:1869-2216(-)